MPRSGSQKSKFIEQITLIIHENISNEQLGVSELASTIGMSRSNLLRKIKKETELSASQFIREVRLHYSLDLLKESNYTVSEVAYKVGFNSPSYFIKCFRELFGYPPGELDKQQVQEQKNTPKPERRKIPIIPISIVMIVGLAIALYFVLKPNPINKVGAKSIAVIPFINDSNDSSNIYIVNGLMDATLNKLQQIKDLRVISRTSVEQYRNQPKSTTEIAEDLNVSYLVEGSGQKIGNEILLNIQLIEAASDKHLWSQQYRRDVEDIFTLQSEVAKNIAGHIKAIVTPEESERIEKAPTQNLVAYDLFLKGLELLHNPVLENLEAATPLFKQAIQHDNEFARAYAGIAISYYLQDELKTEKRYSDSINYYADKAMFFDPQLPQSLTAKALFYMVHNEYELAVPYFEKALEINPNSDVVLVFLVDLYVNHLPNTEKYLEYALRGLELNVMSGYDSTTLSYSYLHMSNAFIQSGFINEAEKYVDRSIAYLPDNLFSEYLKAYIVFARDRNWHQLKEDLLTAYQKDSTRLDVLQEVAKAHYFLGDYQTAAVYYKKFAEIKEMYGLNIYDGENSKIGVTFDKIGEKELADKYLNEFRQYAYEDQSIYRNLSLSAYYSYIGKTDKAIEHLKLFTNEKNFHYWTLLLPDDPMAQNMKKHPEFKEVFKTIEDNFDRYHKRVRKSLKKKGLI